MKVVFSIHKLGVWYDGKIITKLHSGSKHTQFLSLRVIWQNPGFLFVLSLASRTQPKLTKQNHHTKHKTQTQRPINTQTKVLISLSYLFVPVLQPRPQPRPLLVFTTAHVGFPRFGSWIGYPNAFVGLQLGFHSSSIGFFFFSPELLPSHSAFLTSKFLYISGTPFSFLIVCLVLILNCGTDFIVPI